MKCQGNGTTFNDNVKDFGKADNYIFYFPKYSSLVFFIIVTVSTPPAPRIPSPPPIYWSLNKTKKFSLTFTVIRPRVFWTVEWPSLPSHIGLTWNNFT